MIIALSGPAGCGKSTVAEYLSENFGFRRVRFAGPLKEMLRALYRSAGLEEDAIEARIEGPLKEIPDTLLCGRTPRHAMQTLGTEWRDLINRDLWSRIWLSSAMQGPCVVEDMRFEHEYDVVKAHGGIVVRIDRPGMKKSHAHSSEAGLPERCIFDYEIVNSGSLEDLFERAREALYVLRED